MKDDSQISAVLAHLGWLETVIRNGADQSPRTAAELALLTYNAAVILQWRFTCPVSYSDIVQNPTEHEVARGVIQDFVRSSRRAVVDLTGTGRVSEAERLRVIGDEIRKVLSALPPLFRLSAPKAARLALLEKNLDIPQLIQEYLDEQEESAADTGTGKTAEDEESPDAAIHEALATLVYSTSSRANRDAGSPELDQTLIRMAKGFLKTAVDLRAEEQDNPDLGALKELADIMVADAAEAR